LFSYQPNPPASATHWDGTYLQTLKLVFSLDFNVSDHHGEHPLVYINSGNPVSHLRLLAGTERVPKNKLLRVSGYRRADATRRPLIRSTTHTPDHPIDRSQFLHWFVDLTVPSIDSFPKARLIFMTFRELFFHRVPGK
jgi:hypothetical protein